MKHILKNHTYKIKISTLWISTEELSIILKRLYEKLSKEYEEVNLYNILNVVETEQLSTEFERGLIFYFFISTYDNVCISGQDIEDIYNEDKDSIELSLQDLKELSIGEDNETIL